MKYAFITEKSKYETVIAASLRLVAVTEFVDTQEDENGIERPVYQRHWLEEKFNGTGIPAKNCVCCGARVKHSFVVADTSDNLYLVGKTCAGNIRAAAYCNLDQIRLRLVAAALGDHKERVVAAASPEVAAALSWARQGFSRFAADLREKARKYGNLSDAQLSAMVKAHAADAAKRAAATAAVVDGRHVIEGEILSVREQQFPSTSRWGSGVTTKNKVLVDVGGGVKLWGSAPGEFYCGEPQTDSTVVPVVGQRVRFAATVEAGRDPLFGFFKRPAKWQVI